MAEMGTLVAGVAHEVRNPLFSMTATLDAFEARYGVRKEYQKHLGVLRAQLSRLTELMQELLDYGKPPSLELTPLPIGDLVAEAVRACALTARAHKVRFAVHVPGHLPPCCMDRMRMTQVLANLLENAVQHSPVGGSVAVDVRLLAAGDRPWLECVVADAGPGFVPDDLPRVFEPFFTRRRGGTGLGLSLVQRIVEQHGGRVTAENGAGGGGLVRLGLPLGGGSDASPGGPA